MELFFLCFEFFNEEEKEEKTSNFGQSGHAYYFQNMEQLALILNYLKYQKKIETYDEILENYYYFDQKQYLFEKKTYLQRIQAHGLISPINKHEKILSFFIYHDQTK